MKFIREQTEAIQRTGQSVCVIGGPGSGKTRILAERLRWRIEERLPPGRLLGLLSSDAAARRLKRTLAAEFGGQARIREQIERAPITTVHGFAARFLREHAVDAGLQPDFEILDSGEARCELRASAAAALDGLLAKDPESVRGLLEALDSSDPDAAIAEAYEGMRLTFLGGPAQETVERPPEFADAFGALADALGIILAARPQELGAAGDAARAAVALAGQSPAHAHFDALAALDRALEAPAVGPSEWKRLKQVLLPAALKGLAAEYFADHRALLWDAVGRTAQIYHERKQARGVLDGTDLLEMTIGLLRDDWEVRQRVRERYDEVYADDLQDLNPLEEMLIDLVTRPGRLFATGDVNQSVCGVRHADPGVLRRYRERIWSHGQRVDRLRQNHRSRPEILSAVDAVLAGAAGIEAHQFESVRDFPDKAEPSVELLAAHAADPALEAAWVARRIRELAGSLRVCPDPECPPRPARLSDIAVLVPSLQDAPPFEQALEDAGIPWASVHAGDFLRSRETGALTNWLRVVVNPRDEIAMAAVLRSALAGIKDETLVRLKEFGNLGEAVMRLPEADTSAFDTADLEVLRNVRELLAAMRARCDSAPADRLVERAMRATGFEKTLGRRGRRNVESFLALLRKRFAGMPAARVVEELEALRARPAGEVYDVPAGAEDAVRILPARAAKGLEFPVVFVAALDRKRAGSIPAVAFSPTAGLVARWRDPATGAALEEPQYGEFCEDRIRKAHAEDERLLYLAMTRACEHLALSFTAGDIAGTWAARALAGLGVDVTSPGTREQECLNGRRRFTVRVTLADRAPEPLAAGIVPAAPQDLPPALAATLPDDVVSAPSVRMFGECPRRYYLARYIGWNAKPGVVVSEPSRRGGGSRAEVLRQGDLDRQVYALLAGHELRRPDKAAMQLLAQFEASELGRRAAAAERREHDFDFLSDIEGVGVRGSIDLWFIERGQLVVVDFRTREVDEAHAAEYASRFALELQLYSLALERHVRRLPDAAYVYVLRPDVVVPVPLTPADLDRARAAVRALRDAQCAGAYPPHAGEQCRHCEYYRGLCPVGAGAPRG